MTHPTRGAHLDHTAYTPGTWAGGTTRAIWADPTEAISDPVAARYWVGTALIQQAALYSRFAGRARLQIPIHGHGIRLHFRDPAEVIRLDRCAQHQFDGERAVDVELQDGPIIAFNLIYALDVSAEAMVVDVGPDDFSWSLPLPLLADTAAARAAIRIVYVISGALSVRTAGEQVAALNADDTLVCAPWGVAEPAPILASSAPSRAEVILATLWSRSASSDH